MRYAIIYWSRYGNGKRAVEHLAQRLEGRGAEVEVLRTSEANPRAMPEADVYVFSAPAEKFNLQTDMRRFMKDIEGMAGKRYGLINTHGMKRSRLGKMQKILTMKKGMQIVAGVSFQIDMAKSKTGDGLPEGWEQRLDGFALKLLDQ